MKATFPIGVKQVIKMNKPSKTRTKPETRSRQIERKLTKVESLPNSDTANKILKIYSDESE